MMSLFEGVFYKMGHGGVLKKAAADTYDGRRTATSSSHGSSREGSARPGSSREGSPWQSSRRSSEKCHIKVESSQHSSSRDRSPHRHHGSSRDRLPPCDSSKNRSPRPG